MWLLMVDDIFPFVLLNPEQTWPLIADDILKIGPIESWTEMTIYGRWFFKFVYFKEFAHILIEILPNLIPRG